MKSNGARSGQMRGGFALEGEQEVDWGPASD
jgi:hypothetical protein